jgi:uncharacterized protein (DUF488 family)
MLPSPMTIKIVTIGVYGYTEEGFFQALQEACVEVFYDLRQRRGLRGAAYAFANSQRLQARLDELGIRYHHRKDLAPTESIRRRQKEADKAGKVAKRQRNDLSQVFVDAYQDEILVPFDPGSLLEEIGPDANIVALFCVEREPGACHRSLVADKLHRELGLEVEHIVP